MLDTWTPDRVATLTKMWKDGATASTISEVLGNGISRMAVIGKAHRLDLPRRSLVQPPKPVKVNGNRGKPKAAGIVHRVLTRPAPAAEEAVDPGVDVTHLLGLAKLNDHVCRWPVTGQGAATLFCGKHTKDGSVYCSVHHRKAYVTL